MGITSQPQILTQATDAYVNAGTTGKIQNFSGVNGATTYTVTNGAVIRLNTFTSNTSITFTGVPYNSSTGVTYYWNIWYVDVVQPGSYTVTFNGILWDGGVAPTFTSNKRSLVQFYSPDGGTTIYGKQLFVAV
jgi:hypothetical protein